MATHEATCIYQSINRVNNQASFYLVKGKLTQPSESLKILWTWFKFKPSSDLCFQSVCHQIKPKFENFLRTYGRDGVSLSMNKGRSGREITTRTQENMEAVRQSLERNQGRVNARRNGLGISLSWFCWIIKEDWYRYPYKMIRRYNVPVFFSVFCIIATIEDS